MAETVLTNGNFESEVIKSDKPVLVDFWATWCGPCKMVAPIVEEIANEHPEIKVGKVNVDEQQELAARFGIESIPTIMYFVNGQVKDTIIGYRPKEAFEEIIRG